MPYSITLLFLLLGLISLSPCAMAFDGKFPGKGSIHDWQKAMDMHAQADKLDLAGKSDASIRLYQQAIKTYPFDALFYDNLGHLYQEDKRDFRTAEHLYHRAVIVEPTDVHAWLSYAGLLATKGKLKESEQMIDKTSKLPLTDDDRKSISQARAILTELKSKCQPEN